MDYISSTKLGQETKHNKKSISISVTLINAFKISKNKKDPQKCESYNSYYIIYLIIFLI